MDLQSYLRLVNNFPLPDDPSQGTGIGPGMQPQPDIQAPMNNGYNPRTAISSQLTDALGNMPQRPDVGMMKNIAAKIAGLGAGANAQGISGGQPIGFKYNPREAELASDEVKYGKYNNEMSDFQNRVKALGIGANEEDRYNTNERIRTNNAQTQEVNRQKADILQQRADAFDQQVAIADRKENDIHETKMADLDRKIKEADAKLELAKVKLGQGQQSIDNLKAFHDAQINSLNARHNADLAQKNHQLDEAKRMNDSRIERNKILNSKTAGTNESETEQVIRDEKGNITGSKVTKKGPLTKTNIITDPKTNKQYDTSTWSDADKANAALRGWR